MTITYIPATVMQAQSIQPILVDQNWIEKAISNAIQNTIVIPFHNLCIGIWTGFVDVSLPVCTATSMIALAFSLAGVDKAKQWVVIPIIVYLFIQILNGIILLGG